MDDWTPEQNALAGVFDQLDYTRYFPTIGTKASTCDVCGSVVMNSHLQRHVQDHQYPAASPRTRPRA